MIRPALIILVLAACGCASTKPSLTLAHTIQIPKQWSDGSEDANFSDFGVAERYVSAYDRGWWIAVQRYAENTDFDDPSPLVMNGWPEEAYGGQVGYGSACERIEESIRVYGRQRVSDYLQSSRLPDEK